jgi:hypothetical protein
MKIIKFRSASKKKIFQVFKSEVLYIFVSAGILAQRNRIHTLMTYVLESCL